MEWLADSLQGRFSEKGTWIVELVTLLLFFAFFRLHNPKKVNCETTDDLLIPKRMNHTY